MHIKVLEVDIRNSNNRIYPRDEVLRAIDEVYPTILENRLLVTCSPDITYNVVFADVVGYVKSMYLKDNDVMAEISILTPCRPNIEPLISDNMLFGTIAGHGIVSDSQVISQFSILGITLTTTRHTRH